MSENTLSDFRSWNLAPGSLFRAAGRTSAAPPPESMMTRIESVANAFGDHLAVRTDRCQLRYKELLHQAYGVSNWLRLLDIAREDCVVLLCDKTPLVYPAMLGILGAQAAFVPLDPTAPVARNRSLIARVGAKAVVTTAELAVEIDDLVENVALVDEPFAFQQTRMKTISSLATVKGSWQDALPSDMAYVIFTSGSSGEPKGVEVERLSLDTFAASVMRLVGCQPGSRVTQGARLCFDAALQQVVAAFSTGATLMPIPDEIRIDATQMARWLRKNDITHWDCVPSLWSPVVSVLGNIDETPLPTLETLILGGEAPRPDDIDAWLAAVPDTRLINVYGPTEATVNATAYEITRPVGSGPVPIGFELFGAHVDILDLGGNPCEPNIVGEICISGPCLARGYHDDDLATAAAFHTPEPDSVRPTRIYRTGDLGFRQADNSLVCTGRRDSQTKINGMRIEPAEVEAAITNAPGVRQAAVTTYSTAEDNHMRLGAAVVGAHDLDISAVRSHVGAVLPPGMQPTLLLPVKELPRTSSGKVSIQGLRKLFESTPVRHIVGDEVNSTLMQQVLTACAGVLGVNVGPYDDLVERGLDSISALRLRVALDSEGISVRGTDIFAYPTAAALSATASLGGKSSSDRASAPITRSTSTEMPLLPAQKPLLAAALADPTQRSAGLVQEVDFFDLVVDQRAIIESVRQLVGRHQAFRTAILINGDEGPRLRFSAGIGSHPMVHLQEVDDGEVERQVRVIADEVLLQGLDIASPPLLKLSIVTSERRSVLIWTMHHLVTDGWSWDRASREFLSIYRALVAGKPLPTVTPAPTFEELGAALAGQPPDSAVDGLLNELADVVAPTLRGLAEPVSRRTEKGCVSRTLSITETSTLETAAKCQQATLSAVLLHASAAAMSRLMCQPDIAFGLVTSGRHIAVPGVEAAIAPLARLTPIAFHGETSTSNSMYKQIQLALRLEAYELDDALAAGGIPAGVRSPQFTFVFQNYTSGIELGGDSIAMGFDSTRSYSREAANSALAVVVHRRPDKRLVIRLEYWPTEVATGMADQMLREIERELRRTVATSG